MVSWIYHSDRKTKKILAVILWNQTQNHTSYLKTSKITLLIYFCYLFEQSQDKKNQDVITGSLLQGLDNQNTEDKAVSTYSEHQER